MVYMLLGTGFEETEAVAPIDLLRRAGVSVATVGIGGKVIVGSHGIPVTADMELGQMDLTQLDMIVLPGGMKGVASIKGCPEALEAVQFAWENGRFRSLAEKKGLTTPAKLALNGDRLVVWERATQSVRRLAFSQGE